MPTGHPIPQTVIDYTMDLFVQGLNKSEISRVVGVSRYTVIRIVDAYAIAQRLAAQQRVREAAKQSRHDALVDGQP